MNSVRPEGVRPHTGYRFARENAVPWAFALVPKLWRAEGNNAANQMLISPMIGYHFADGWALSSSPKIIANWIANGNKWTVGGSVSKIGEQPIRFGPAARP
jgi:hypothetical protein